MAFICPHCGINQITTEKATASHRGSMHIGPFAEMKGFEKAQTLMITSHAARCANEDCNRITVLVGLGLGNYVNGSSVLIPESIFTSKRLYPPTCGKPFPVGVPEEMLEDYNEAWAILDLSPKSSATLARRCLQAMIRDFCNIRKRTLFDEIDALEKQLVEDKLPKGVEPETVAAMKVLKDKGNIGAHMTEVEGKIVNVDPDEARQLLGLIEMLFSDWYVARHKRRERLAAIEAMANPQASKP